MDIVIDFDGTCCAHDYPRIGADIGAIPVLLDLVRNGHKLILSTMRDDKPGGTQTLTEAVNWLKFYGVELSGIQKNPTQHKWTTSPKAYGQLIIDDAALGCPLVHPQEGRPYADWIAIRRLLDAPPYSLFVKK